MKIYNLILLNFYFLQNFSLIFGMHPGEGPSGSQPRVDEFTHLSGLISPLLETVGDTQILQGITPRVLKNPARHEDITNVRKQYNNLVYAYMELFNTNAINEQINSLLEYLYQNMVKNIILFNINFYLAINLKKEIIFAKPRLVKTERENK
uniref:Uncharacterized protein n=1 Tax=Meloidogyne enterolobii TaxID=390850 RepID=A0A6V7XVB3_MELEN|nr:unnamed protein product [Meloidogyne enterolobii]